jgi:hypothetical protein
LLSPSVIPWCKGEKHMHDRPRSMDFLSSPWDSVLAI